MPIFSLATTVCRFVSNLVIFHKIKVSNISRIQAATLHNKMLGASPKNLSSIYTIMNILGLSIYTSMQPSLLKPGSSCAPKIFLDTLSDVLE